jgi:hypothetical protein
MRDGLGRRGPCDTHLRLEVRLEVDLSGLGTRLLGYRNFSFHRGYNRQYSIREIGREIPDFNPGLEL